MVQDIIWSAPQYFSILTLNVTWFIMCVSESAEWSWKSDTFTLRFKSWTLEPPELHAFPSPSHKLQQLMQLLSRSCPCHFSPFLCGIFQEFFCDTEDQPDMKSMELGDPNLYTGTHSRVYASGGAPQFQGSKLLEMFSEDILVEIMASSLVPGDVCRE